MDRRPRIRVSWFLALDRPLKQHHHLSRQPVICSIGNTGASGGYYIATDCDRIFALPNTVTGSIGVFGVRLDMTGFAARYGIHVDHLSGGPHTFTYSPFHPMTRAMKSNFSRSIDRYYDHFKSIVAHGRGLSLEHVEDIAQGRVWTGEQAKTIGLVDELGGLDRALAYAKRKYTGGDASVEVWPKPKTFMDLMKALGEDDSVPPVQQGLAILCSLFGLDLDDISPPSGQTALAQSSAYLPTCPSSTLSGIMLTADENMAVKNVLLEWQASVRPHTGPWLSPWMSPGFWE